MQTLPTQEANEDLLVELMVEERSGPAVMKLSSRNAIKNEARDISVEDMTLRNDKKNQLVRNVSLDVYRGEIVGLIGVAGNGQREVAEAIFGLRRTDFGKITIQDQDISQSSVRDRLKAGVAFVPEDRIRQGILPNMSLAETLVLGPHNFLFGRSLVFDRKKTDQIAQKAINDYEIKAPDERIRTCLLSGWKHSKSRRRSGISTV